MDINDVLLQSKCKTSNIIHFKCVHNYLASWYLKMINKKQAYGFLYVVTC